MKKQSKFRTDSVLGNLPPQRQEQIAEFLEVVKDGDRYAATCAWLADDGLKVSRSALWSWYQQFALRRDMTSADELAAFAQQAARERDPKLTAAELEEIGNKVFTAASLAARDQKSYVDIQYLKLAQQSARTKADLETAKLKIRKAAEARAERKLRLEREKFEISAAEKMLDARLRSKADEINASSLSQAEKIAAMRKAAFADVTALERSGRVQIPE